MLGSTRAQQSAIAPPAQRLCAETLAGSRSNKRQQFTLQLLREQYQQQSTQQQERSRNSTLSDEIRYLRQDLTRIETQVIDTVQQTGNDVVQKVNQNTASTIQKQARPESAGFNRTEVDPFQLGDFLQTPDRPITDPDPPFGP